MLRLFAEIANAKAPGPILYAGGAIVAGAVAAWIVAALLRDSPLQREG